MGSLCVIVPNFVVIGQTIADMTVNFFNMAAVRHLGFVVRVFGQSTHLVFIVVLNLIGIDAVISIICMTPPLVLKNRC